MKKIFFKTTNSLPTQLLKTAAVALLALALPVSAQLNTTATLSDYGSSAPTPGANDVYQTTTSPSGNNSNDGLNYYWNSSPPSGQTFTTGSSTYGYTLQTLSFQLADNASLPGSQTYTLQIYSVSGSTATLLATYTSQSINLANATDWLQWTNLGLNLDADTQYAYTFYGANGWCQFADVTGDPYSGGQICQIPASGGTITYGSTGGNDAVFVVGLTTNSAALTISGQPANQNVVEGQPASFTVSVSGVSPQYQWFTCSDTNYDNPAGIPDATNSTYTIASTTLADSTNFFVIVTNSSGSSVTSSVVTLVVALNGAAILSDIGSSTPTPGAADVYQLTSGNALNVYFNNNPPNGQTFTTGTNSYGYTLNTLALQLADDVANIPSGGQTYWLGIYSVSGGNATLLAVYTSQTNFVFSGTNDWLQWNNLNFVLQPNTQYAYTFYGGFSWPTYPSENGWARLSTVSGSSFAGGEACTIPSGGGAVTLAGSSDDATFDVGLTANGSTALSIAGQPVSQDVVEGQPASFTVSVGGPSPQYQWFTCSDASYDNPAGIPDATNSTYTIASTTLASATNFFVVATNSYGSSVTSTVATLVVALNGSATLVDAGSSAPTPGAADVYQLTSGNALNVYFNNNPPNGQTFTTGNNSDGYILNTLSLQLADDVNYLPSGGQTYWLGIYSVSGGNATLLAVYTSQNNFVITGPSDWLQWNNLNFILNPNTQYAYTFYGGMNWGSDGGWGRLSTVSGSSFAGGEACTISSGGGAVTLAGSGDDATFDVALIVNSGLPIIVQQPVSLTRYAGGSASFSVSAAGMAPFTYQWNKNGSALSGQTNATLTLANVQSGDAANYTVTVTNLNGSTNSAAATLTVLTTGYGAVVCGDQPLAYYPLNETSGTVAYDYMNGYNGTFINGPLLGLPGATTNTGTAVGMDGQYVDISSSYAGLNFSGPVTLEAWISPYSILSGNIIAHDDGTGGYGQLYLQFQSSGSYGCGTYAVTNAGQVVETVPDGTLDNWVHVVGTYDGTNWNVYQNGALLGSAAVSDSGSELITGDWSIGSGTGNESGTYYDGSIQDAAIYNYALSPAQIQSHYYIGEYGIPVPLQIARSGGVITLTWSVGTLQQSTNVAGPYSDVPGATSPYNPPSGPSRQFYRVRY